MQGHLLYSGGPKHKMMALAFKKPTVLWKMERQSRVGPVLGH